MASPQPRTRKKSTRKPVDPLVLEQRRFARSIRTMFANMGFTHIPTEGKEAKFGKKTGELDSVFIYENVLLVVEDTTTKKPFDHAKNKRLLAEQIHGSKVEFIQWLRSTFPEQEEALKAYSPKRFQLFYLYISRIEMDLDDDDLALLEPMKIVTNRALNYFDKLAKTIRRSAKTEPSRVSCRFLSLKGFGYAHQISPRGS
jgi:hypothetical protein